MLKRAIPALVLVAFAMPAIGRPAAPPPAEKAAGARSRPAPAAAPAGQANRRPSAPRPPAKDLPSPDARRSAAPDAESIARLEVDVFVPNVTRGELLPLRVLGWTATGARRNVTQRVEWRVSPPERGAVDALDRFEGREPGMAQIVARLGPLESPPMEIEVLAEGRPDWSVGYIERFPRDSGADATPRPGETLLWCAHVKNYGTAAAPPVAVEWRVDGVRIRGGRLPKLERFASTEVILTLPQAATPREVTLVVDPEGAVAETSEKNNAVTVSTHSLPAGFWVEESVYRHFHHHQLALGDGSNSWEDWAQRQVRFWNAWQRVTAWLSPGPKPEFLPWRVDRIVVVRDGLLPLAGGSARFEPDRRETSLRWMRGFPAADLHRFQFPARTTSAGDAAAPLASARTTAPFYLDFSLLPEPVRRP